DGIRLRSRKKKGHDAGGKHSAYCSTVPIRGAVRFVLCLRVHRAHFLIGIPVAVWRRENCVHGSIRSNLEWHMTTRIGLIASPQRSLSCHGRVRAESRSGTPFLFDLGHERFFFYSRNLFGRHENKISNKFIFFLSILKAISSLKPAGEEETRAHVNKL